MLWTQLPKTISVPSVTSVPWQTPNQAQLPFCSSIHPNYFPFPSYLSLLIFKSSFHSHHKTFPSSPTCLTFLLLPPAPSPSGKSSSPSIKDKIQRRGEELVSGPLKSSKEFHLRWLSPLLLQTHSFHNAFQQWPQPDSFTTANLYQHLMYFMCPQWFFLSL